jgi:UDP-glucose 4-epimerase
MSGELILVTGGCGFIGSHLCEELVGCGCRVRVLDDLSSGYRANLNHLESQVDVVIGDVRDPAAVQQAVQGAWGVFHEAALVSVFDSVKRPGDCHDINATGTLNVLQAARAAGVKRVVLASTAAAYGNDPELPKREDMRPQPESPYAVAKVAGEHYQRIFSSLYGLETVTLRYFNVFGPRQDPRSPYSGVISKFTDDIKAGRTPTIFGDGLQSRDFVFVKDVAQANLLAMFGRVRGEGQLYNVASGATATLLELLAALGRLVGRPIQPLHREARAGDIRHSSASIARAKDELGYAPRFSLEAGLRELLKSLGML